MSEQNSNPAVNMDPDLSKPPGPNMVRVTFLPEGRSVEFEYGTMPYEHHGKPMSFLDVAENFNIFLDHACGGSCACTTCHIWVKKGEENISEAEDEELDRMETAADRSAQLPAGLPGGHHRPRYIRRRDTELEPQLCFRG